MIYCLDADAFITSWNEIYKKHCEAIGVGYEKVKNL